MEAVLIGAVFTEGKLVFSRFPDSLVLFSPYTIMDAKVSSGDGSIIAQF
jgi:hypothetical protein